MRIVRFTWVTVEAAATATATFRKAPKVRSSIYLPKLFFEEQIRLLSSGCRKGCDKRVVKNIEDNDIRYLLSGKAPSVRHLIGQAMLSRS